MSDQAAKEKVNVPEETNVDQDQPTKEANAIPAIAADTKDTDEWSHLYPCAQEILKGVEGEARSVAAYTLGRHFRADNVPQNFTLSTLLSWNRKNDPPLEESEIEEAVSAVFKGRGGKSFNSRGCANEVVQTFCDSNCLLSPNHAKGDAGRYFQGKDFIPKLLADELASEYYFIYAAEQLYAYEDGFYKPNGEVFAKQKCREKLHYSATIYTVNEVIAHIIDMSHKEQDDLNLFKNLINVENGMLEWQSGKLLPHSPHYLSALRIPVFYNSEAKCPEIDRFLETTLPEDCIDLAVEWLGYILLPITSQQRCLLVQGVGSNGKSIFISMLTAFISEANTAHIALQSIDNDRFKRESLVNKLVNLFADLDANDLRSSSYFKAIVSGDQIDAEKKFKPVFFFRPFARLIYSANDIPRSPDKTFAFYRRLCIIPFPNQFLGSKADRGLIEKLITPQELSGLLNRAIGGLRRLFANGGFTEPETVKKALAEYQKWNDPVSGFIQDKCEIGINNRIERQTLFTFYSKYCLEEGFRTESRNAFYKGVRSFPGVGEVEAHDGNYIFTGIKLKSK